MLALLGSEWMSRGIVRFSLRWKRQNGVHHFALRENAALPTIGR
jgi:hypothetical protein